MDVDFESQDIIIELSPEGQDGKSVRPLGDWSATEEYHALDLVTYQGESFIALKDVPEGILPTNTEYWMVNASNKTVYWGTIEGTLAEQTDLATALAEKADADDVYTKTETDSLLEDKADADAVYTKSETDDLLDLKANAADVYTQTELDGIFDGIDNALSTKADKTDVYTKAETDGLLNDKADADSVYTKTEADALLAEKADADDVYTKTEADNLLSAKANTADLGNLAEKDTVDYQTEVTNKPTLGSLSSLDSISYESNYLTDKPNLGTMSAEDDAPSDDAQYVRKNGAWEDLAPTLNDKADVIKSTASGSLVHLTDAAAMPVESLTVGIEPVQDLHGQSAPYPAGGGKNILPGKNLSQTVNTIACSFTTDDLLTINGTNSSANNAYFNIYANSAGERVPISAGTYTFSSKTTLPSGLNITLVFKDSGGSDITSIPLTPSQQSKNATIAVDCEYMVYCTIVGNATISYNGGLQLEKGSTATAWSPYSNICSISGHATATVTRAGENLFDVNSYYSVTSPTVIENGTVKLTTSYKNAEWRLSVKPGTFTMSYHVDNVPNGVGIYLQAYPLNGTSFDQRAQYQNSSGSTKSADVTKTFTVTNQTLLRMRMYLDNTANDPVVASNIQLEYGSTATAYAPYQGTSVTIDLDGTRYGGTVDVRTGAMTVDRVMVTIDGVEHKLTSGPSTSGGYTYYACYLVSNFDVTSYNTNSTNISKFISNRFQTSTSGSVIPRWYVASTGTSIYVFLADQTIQTRADANSWFASNNTDFVVPLAEPFTVQLTPAELSLLYGTNNLWASTGDVNVGYRADTKLYIDRKITELTALILEN